MQQINQTLEDMGVTPAPKPIEPNVVRTRSKKHRLRSTKPAGESKAARRLRRFALTR